jgi:hypothetical protein
MNLPTRPAPGSWRMAEPVLDASAPAYDPLALLSLAETAGENAAQRFLDDYLNLLPHRRFRIVGAQTAGDTKDAMDAILSLRVTSMIVGTAWLTHFCRQLQDQLTDGETADAAEIAEELDLLVSLFVRAVQARP